MSRKRVTYRPSKPGSVAGGVMGCVFVLIGLFVIIPQFAMVGGFGLIFGIFWTILAAVIAGTNFYSAFGKKYIGPEIHIEEEESPPAPPRGPLSSGWNSSSPSTTGGSSPKRSMSRSGRRF